MNNQQLVVLQSVARDLARNALQVQEASESIHTEAFGYADKVICSAFEYLVASKLAVLGEASDCPVEAFKILSEDNLNLVNYQAKALHG